ncbi:MAG: TIGR02285 family protein [Desulfobacterales bacterium]|nr:TIGR02285 family protein [Desulfobacterales bacterium]
MNNYKRILFIFISIILMFAGNSQAEKKELIWLKGELPPYVILSGPFKKMGNIDYIQNLVEQSLREYKHISMVANTKRIFFELKKRDMVAFASALKTKEREKNVIYSIPYLLVLPNAILIKKSKLKFFKPYINKGVFSLEKTVKESDFKLGIEAGRAYGSPVDKILMKYKGNKNIKVYYDNISRKFAKNLLKNNIDYTIGYSCEMTYFLKKLKKKENVISVPIKGMHEYLLVYFVFPKTKWGKKVVIKVNTILRKHRNTELFHKSYEYWLDNMGKKIYRKYVKEFYRKK